MNSFGEKLKRDRQKVGLSQLQLAAAMGVSQQAVARWETNNSFPRKGALDKLIQVLGPDAEIAGHELPENYDQIKRVQVTHHAPVRVDREVLVRSFDSRTTPRYVRTLREDERDFIKYLNPELREYTNNVAGIGTRRWEFDYLSPSLAIEIKHIRVSHQAPPNIVLNYVRPLLQLAVAKKVLPGERKYMLLFVTDMSSPVMRQLQSIMFDAEVLGVEVSIVSSTREAADLVAFYENKLPLPPPDEESSSADDSQEWDR